ncbi:threonine/serine dehydratase [Pragia fontium]|uniref:Threonine dehydratase n=1 Tax=Pragia fontium DSM 5563 = ATCC 49100 TaxID=1122977 RepID=A0AAJ5BIL4_9GAMM|nr:threonine/serine dehydratase [Pragia fontium]SFD39903.1 threonine dehydratase [Pragia fontium DSM 5563 = ATCC 49100]SUB80916.1 L-threonine dehydratase catabolic TdcB [Pragia fontium]VEJ52730.1 L-threonine dehydratase catabolic TdcB [Pragia fontium]
MQSLYQLITEAHTAIRPQVRTTPLDFSPLLSLITDCELYLKCEHLQHTGSFKFRGAVNKLRMLNDTARESGVITASTGNHGQALALAARSAGIPVTVYAPATAAQVKLDAICAYGADVELVEGDALTAELEASRQANLQGKPFISPYNDKYIIAGQGTAGMEMIEQQADLDAIFVAVGGGGLISGIGAAFKHLSPNTKIIGCWPANATSMYASLKAGSIIEVAEQPTLSDGTAGGIEPGAITFPLCQQVIDRYELVSEEQIRHAMRLVARTDRWMIEGAAGVALAAAIKLAPQFKGKKIAVVLCGKNIVLEKFINAVAE